MTLSASEWALSVNLIPIVPRGKKPLIEWKQYQEEFSWGERAAWKKQWPDMNYGLVTGSISGVVAIDFDGPEGKALFEKHKVLGTAPVSETANGDHALYMIPDEPIGNATGIVPGLDFRGEGGYVVIPPSVHPTGKKYRWIDPPWKKELRPAPPLPEWFWPLWNAYKVKEAREQAAAPLMVPSWNLSFDDFAREHGCEVPPGGWIADGRIHRCDAYGPDGKLGRADGSYKVHPDNPVNGYIQNHHRHQQLITQQWRAAAR
jgi:hypothetical protein